jgi:3-oxoacyl-[acyl-carrier protein] reductase
MDSRPDQTALITGVSRAAGIGTAITRRLAQSGAAVFITYYRPYDQVSGLAETGDEPENLMAELRQMGVRAEGLEVDLSDPQAAAQVFDRAESVLGSVNVLVNNAAFSLRDGIEVLNADLLDRHYAVNVRGMALLCVEFVRRYRQNPPKAGFGRIINLSSGQGLGPMPGELAYAASKGAVEAFTRSLSAEVGPLGITVNAIDPGITDTGWIDAGLRARWQAESPMGRVGVPDDAARLAAFLASAEAGWITGQVIHSRGGL